jgi:hypothetical protein
LAGGPITVSGTISISPGGIGTTQLSSSAVTYAKIQNVSASSLLGNPTGGGSAPQEITLGAGLSFSGSTLVSVGGGGTITSLAAGTGLSGGTITTSGTIAIAAGGVGTTQLANSGVTYAKLQNVSAAALLGSPTGGAAPVEITIGTGLSFSGSTLVSTSSGGTVTSLTTGTGLTGGPITSTGTIAIAAGGIGATQLATSAVQYGNIQNVNASRILGNPGVTSAAPSEITLGAGLSFSGSALTATGTVASVTAGTGLSGGTITTSGTVAIAAGGVGTTQLAASAVQYANIQNVSASKLLGNPTGSGASPSEITIGTGLSFSGSTLNATSGGGTVTSLSAGTGLTGGTITTSGTVALAATGLTITQSAGSVSTATQSAGTATVDWSLSNNWQVTLNANLTIAFSNVPSSQSQKLKLKLIQAASGGPFTIAAFPSGTTWVGSSGPPGMPATASSYMTVVFESTSSTTWDAYFLGVNGVSSGGGTAVTETSETASFSAAAGNLYAISGSSAVTATLPTAVGITGQTIRLRCANGYTGLLTIATTSSQTLGPSGATSQILYAGESALVQSDGSNWVRTGGTIIPASCTITPAGTQSIPDLTSTKVAFDTLAYDNTGQMAVTASNEIQILRPGRYAISASAYFDSLSAQEYSILADVFTNGSPNGLTFRTLIPIATGSLPTNVILVPQGSITCAAGDVITLNISQVNTAASAETLFQGPYTFLTVTEIPRW